MATKQDLHQTLTAIGFHSTYIQRAFKVYEKNYGESYNAEVITEIIVRLQNKDRIKGKQTASKHNPSNKTESTVAQHNNSKPQHCGIFHAHMSLSEAHMLSIGDIIDHRDDCGRFLQAKINEKNSTLLKIQYIGLGVNDEIVTDYKTQLHKFAKLRSISQRPAHRFKSLKKGDYVDINPIYTQHKGWKCGEINLRELGQIQVCYEVDDTNYFYWTHLDNIHEIAPFTTKSGTSQTVQLIDNNRMKTEPAHLLNEEKQKADKEYDDPFAVLIDESMLGQSQSPSKRVQPLKESETVSIHVENVFTANIQNTNDPFCDLKVQKHDEEQQQQVTTENKHHLLSISNPFEMDLWDNDFDGSVVESKEDTEENNPFYEDKEENECDEASHDAKNELYLKQLQYQIQLETANEQIKQQQQAMRELQRTNDELRQNNNNLNRQIKILSANEQEINRLNLEQLKKLESRMEKSLQFVQMSREILFEDTHLCIVCKDNVKDIMMDGCQHFVLCSECAEQLDPKMCPICRSAYNSTTQLVI